METIEDSYGFSEGFLDFMQKAAAQDPMVAAVDETDIAEETPEEDDVPEEEDWKGKYDELQSENETLKNQVADYRFAQNETIQNDDLLYNSYNQGGNSSILNMVMNDEITDVVTKSNKVNLQDVDPDIKGYLNNLQNKFGSKVVVTSGNDQEHAPNSRHYKGEAVDIRYSPEVHKYISHDPLAKQLGLNVLDPNHGTAPHTHIQKKQNGGKYITKYGGKDKEKAKNNEASNEWLKQWYEQRSTLPEFHDDSISNLNNLQNIPIEEADKDYLKKENATAYAQDGKIYLNSKDWSSISPSVQIHEKTHVLNQYVGKNEKEAMWANMLNNSKQHEKELLSPNITQERKEQIWKEVRDLSDEWDKKKSGYDTFSSLVKSNLVPNDSEYLSNPTEVYARINQVRARYKLDPKKKYTSEEIQQITQPSKNDPHPYYLRDILKVVGGDMIKLTNLLNGLASNNKKTTSISKYGGKYKV